MLFHLNRHAECRDAYCKRYAIREPQDDIAQILVRQRDKKPPPLLRTACKHAATAATAPLAPAPLLAAGRCTVKPDGSQPPSARTVRSFCEHDIDMCSRDVM